MMMMTILDDYRMVGSGDGRGGVDDNNENMGL